MVLEGVQTRLCKFVLLKDLVNLWLRVFLTIYVV